MISRVQLGEVGGHKWGTEEIATKGTQVRNTEKECSLLPLLSLASYGISQREHRKWRAGHICAKGFILGKIHLWIVEYARPTPLVTPPQECSSWEVSKTQMPSSDWHPPSKKMCGAILSRTDTSQQNSKGWLYLNPSPCNFTFKNLHHPALGMHLPRLQGQNSNFHYFSFCPT